MKIVICLIAGVSTYDGRLQTENPKIIQHILVHLNAVIAVEDLVDK